MSRNMKSVVTKRQSMEMAYEVAEYAAGVLYYRKTDSEIDADRQYARGCSHTISRHRLAVIDRGERLARQHQRGGIKFAMVVDALERMG